MLLNLNLLRQQLERGLRRAYAEVGRPLNSARDVLYGTSITADSDSLYAPLSKGYIRLLTVRHTEEGTYDCRLNTFRQDLAPRYDAVSYCWGDDDTPAEIQCNGFALEVRMSLLALLKACCERNDAGRPVWMDAICLDQKNEAEKSVQVPLMNEIYMRAARTIIWLGAPDEKTESTIVLIKTMTDFTHTYGKAEFAAAGCDNFEDFGLTVFGEERWCAMWEDIREYLGRPWFQRLWTVQEVLLSWDVQVMCGTELFHIVQWNDFCRFESALKRIDGDFKLLPKAGAPRVNGLSQQIGYIETMRKVLQRNRYFRVSDLQHFYGDRTCREPVDRLWGFLGLLSPELVLRIGEAGIINYSVQSRREYWTSYIAFMKVLHTFDSIDFFNLITNDICRRKTSPLPSWCIDFNEPRNYTSLRQTRRFRAGFVGPRDYTTPKTSLEASNCILSVTGFVIDDVSDVSSVYETYNLEAKEESELQRQAHLCWLWLRQCSALCRSAQNRTALARVEPLKALYSTLLATDKTAHNESSDFMPGAHQKLEKAMHTLSLGVKNLENLKAETPPSEWEEYVESFSEYWTNIQATCDNRKVFITQRGHIGLGPTDLQAGDQICAFVGGETLFALRKATTQVMLTVQLESAQDIFSLIGDTYVYGLMFGEAFCTEGRGPTEKLSLI